MTKFPEYNSPFVAAKVGLGCDVLKVLIAMNEPDIDDPAPLLMTRTSAEYMFGYVFQDEERGRKEMDAQDIRSEQNFD